MKVFYLLAYFEELQCDSLFATKRMFGSLAIYYHGLNVAVLSESPGETTYRNKVYSISLWDGVLFPTEREHHPSLLHDFPALIPHPILGKWLYLSQSSEEFENTLTTLVEKIIQKDIRLGIAPNLKKKKLTKKHTPS